ncbi:hypothetical protein ABHF33_10990 [Chitinibacter sp. FCG-7]|uniref:Uncharacterized protein n=1 Tax=Chitinibacter mangrovi TaxID=3153927 RepID=A0AAU7F506_9NEIS
MTNPTFNPMPDHHVLKDAIDRIAKVYDFGGAYDVAPNQHSPRDRFNVYNMGNLAGQTAYAMAAHAAEGNPAALIDYCKSALLVHLFGSAKIDQLTAKKQAKAAFIIGLLGDLEDAFGQPPPKLRPSYRLHRLPTQRHK